jgi:DNA-binding response OmpR family regulator
MKNKNASQRKHSDIPASTFRIKNMNSRTMTLDQRSQSVRLGERRIFLTPREFAVLRTLMRHRGSVVPRRKLLMDVWGFADRDISRCLNVHVHALRRKMESEPSAPAYIRTVRGRGLLLAA